MTLDINQFPGHGSGYSDDKITDANPWKRDYIGWRPGDEYMYAKDGWAQNGEFETWKDFWGEYGDSDLDLNLIADFYFSDHSVKCWCNDAGYNGYNKETAELYDSWYGKPYYRGGWSDSITDDEFEALKKHGRTKGYNSAEEMNRAVRTRDGVFIYDAINAHVCVEARAKRLGVYGLCSDCNGHSWKPTGKIKLYLWMLHPRKGCGKGVTINSVEAEDIPQVKQYLKDNFEQHRSHFAWALAD